VIIFHSQGIIYQALYLTSVNAYLMYAIKASKTYSHSAKNRNNKTKKAGYKLYFYDENGNFHSKRVSAIKALWINLFTKKYKVKQCRLCGQKYLNSCPNC
tara:strand:+ start:1972 stop:2271 length:300 start_codon:yes stop_codon:yes gene_type:complete